MFTELPRPIRDDVEDAWLKSVNHWNFLSFQSDTHKSLFYSSVAKVWAASPFVSDIALTAHRPVSDIIENGHIFNLASADYYLHKLTTLLEGVVSVEELMSVLRQFRKIEMFRIAWRDIAGWAALDETLMELTWLAETCINQALDHLFKLSCLKYGTPLDLHGQPQRLIVLGMGKLGAWELNFSSDIDLIFVYELDGELPNKRIGTYKEFYIKLAQSLIKVLDEPTPEGFVFRVDARLRPFGDVGPLVINFDGVEQYYQTQAREWERYAMVKARVVAGDEESGNRLQKILTPFVYRRYLDYRAFGELRSLKQKINTELQKKAHSDNIKLGYGGIREIEFICQAFQLIRGGQNIVLRERRVLYVLRILAELGCLPTNVVGELVDCYKFLRLVENRIQQYADKQTHDLPLAEKPRVSLCYAMGYANWELFMEALNVVRSKVHRIFTDVIDTSDAPVQSDQVFDCFDLDHSSTLLSITSLGYENPQEILNLLVDFSNTYSIRRTSPRGGAELNRVLPKIIEKAARTNSPKITLGRLLSLLESIASRNVYFTLLAENPAAIERLVNLASESSWIIGHITKYPSLLDELLDPRTLYSPLTLSQLSAELQHGLDKLDLDDFESVLTVLRQFKQANVLRIAASDIIGAIPLMTVSDYLTWLAEVLTNAALSIAWQLLAKRHGTPPNAPSGFTEGIGIIAYGKMGGYELSYSSDLDLVFLYDGEQENILTNGEKPIPCVQFYSRVVKRIIGIITTQILSGTLYEIDLRLRPSGKSGLLISSLDAYESYQKLSAWTWEQQALVRARFVGGDPKVKERFEQIRKSTLSSAREADILKADVREMREKMRSNLEHNPKNCFDVKQSRGGIADIEFIVQYGVLLNACSHPEILQWTDVVRLLGALQTIGFLTGSQVECLKNAYCSYREHTHRAALLEQSPLVADSEFLDMRSGVSDIWHQKMEA